MNHLPRRRRGVPRGRRTGTMLRALARRLIEQIVDSQKPQGGFRYGGADPGYQPIDVHGSPLPLDAHTDLAPALLAPARSSNGSFTSTGVGDNKARKTSWRCRLDSNSWRRDEDACALPSTRRDT